MEGREMAGKGKLEKAAEEAAMKSFEQVPELAEAVFSITEAPDMDLKDLVEYRDVLTDTVKKYGERLKEINDQLILAMRAAEQEKVKLWNGIKLEVRNGTSPSKIEATKLLEHGVSLETIQESTTPGTPYQFIMVVKPKAGKEE